jgi:hypothetical protein
MIQTGQTGGVASAAHVTRAISAFWGQLLAGALALACAVSSARGSLRTRIGRRA